MKKLMFAVAALTAGFCVADITSANTVGYQQFTVLDDVNPYVTGGAAFTQINGGTKWTCETQLFGTDVFEGDQIMIFQPDFWDLENLQYLGAGNGWQHMSVDPDTWADINEVIQNFKLDSFVALTYQPNDCVSGLNVAGQVVDLSKPAVWSIENDVYYAPIMNPYPIDTTLGDLETFVQDGDQIYFFRPDFWDLENFQFLGDGNGWQHMSVDTSTWEDINEIITDKDYVILKAGHGATFQPADAATGARVWEVSLKK